MDAAPEPTHNPSEQHEYRRHERIYEPFPAMIRSVDASGEAFQSHALLDNLSAGGFYVRLDHRVEPGTKLFAVVRISTSPPEVPGPRVAMRGIVLRVEPQPDGTWGIAVRFTRYRFL